LLAYILLCFYVRSARQPHVWPLSCRWQMTRQRLLVTFCWT